MAPEKINLECISAFYDEIRNTRGTLGRNTFTVLMQYRNELNHVIENDLLKGEGLKAAISLKSKLDKVYSTHQEKQKELEKYFN